MSHRGKKLRGLADPFVIAPPDGARVRTRLMVDAADRAVLEELGAYLGRLASADLAKRVSEGALTAKEKAESRRERKRELTAASSSRWAGTITRTTEDAYGLAKRNLAAERRSLQARVAKLAKRTKVAAGEKKGKVFGYATACERWQKQCRLQVLTTRLAAVETQLATGALSICRGGRRRAKNRHNLATSGQTPSEWRDEWEASRWFITADGERDKPWGNETIRWHPIEGWLEIKLPDPLAQMANRPHGRYRLSAPVTWPHRGDEVAAQATGGSLRYDITYDSGKDRWYIDASWGFDAEPIASLDQLRRGRVVAVDLNLGHLAAAVLDSFGNPIGVPTTIPLALDGMAASHRDGLIRSAISQILAVVVAHHAAAVVIENLDFVEGRIEGREHTGNRPSRGRRGKTFRRHISGLPTAKLRDRLSQMAHNLGISVVAVDPAYTSRWGAQHWLDSLKTQYPTCSLTGHHAAAVAIGRRGLGQRLRRRDTSARTSPVDGERATASASKGGPIPVLAGLPDDAPSRETKPRNGMGHPPKDGRETVMPTGREEFQAAQDRSVSPAEQYSLSLSA